MIALTFSWLLHLTADPALAPRRLLHPAFATDDGTIAYLAETWHGDQLRRIAPDGVDTVLWDAATGKPGRTILQFAAAGDGWLAVARDTGKAPALWRIDSRGRETALTPNDWPEGERRGAALLHHGGGEWLLTLDRRLPYFPDVYRYRPASGSLTVIEVNPGDVSTWLANEQGEVSLRLRHPLPLTERRSASPADAPLYLWEWREHPLSRWRRLRRWRLGEPAWQALRLSRDGLWLNAESQRRDTFGLQHLLLPAATLAAPRVARAGADLTAVIFSPQSGRPLIAGWEGLLPRQEALDEDWAAVLAALDAARPTYRLQIAQLSADESKALVTGFDGREPERWWQFDRTLSTFHELGTERDPTAALPASLMPFRFTARDGLPLTAYYTPPAGGGSPQTPLLVLVHGGPWARDRYRYEALPALLAGRGIGVLQVNFRGSEGFGRRFLLAGAKAWGGAMQDDLADGVAALTARGLADPRRVCIAGMSYGGYAALHAVLTEPDRYRCALAHGAVTDLSGQIAALAARGDTLGAREWQALVGDPDTEAEKLAARSPLNLAAQLKRPVLLSHGAADSIVEAAQSRAFRARAPADLVYSFAFAGGHRLSTAAERLTIYLNWLFFVEAQVGRL